MMPTRVAATAIRTARTSTCSTTLRRAACRDVGASCRLLTTKTPQKPPVPTNSPPKPSSSSSTSSSSSSSTTSSNSYNPNEMENPPDVNLEVTPEMKMANLALAAVLVGFVSGVWWYSMNSVGSQDKDGDDPLAQLKMEAQEAMDRQEKDNTPDQRAQQLLQEFNRGVHDPDQAELNALEELDKLEKEEGAKKKKKSWWKFW